VSVPRPDPITIGGIEISFGTRARLYTIIAVLLLLTMAVMYRIDRSRLAKVLAAIRQGDVLAESVGINLTRYRVGAFTIAALFTTAAGAFSAHYYSTAHPEVWGFWPSIFIITYAIIGGIGSLYGPVVGATVGVVAVEVLRATEGLQGMLLGLALIVAGLVMPGGLMSLLSKDTLDRFVARLPGRRRETDDRTGTSRTGGEEMSQRVSVRR
jgi:branched-chain amino acid transport system permease protein